MYRRGRDEEHLAVHGGFAEVDARARDHPGRDRRAPDEIDRARAERARQRAEQRMAGRDPDGEGEIDYDDAVAAYQRALTRLLVVAIGGG